MENFGLVPTKVSVVCTPLPESSVTSLTMTGYKAISLRLPANEPLTDKCISAELTALRHSARKKW